tara:strand:+ start:300 stop:2114 length:1815 start_codon:yes stop_codon:yes gene_type:complete
MASPSEDIDWILQESNLVSPTPQELVNKLSEYKPVEKSPDDPVTVMILGLPGSGKGTRIRGAMDNLHYNLKAHTTGDIMWALAQDRYGDRVEVRDDMRKKLTPAEQRQLQLEAVIQTGKGSREKGYVHLVDCHCTTKTEGGFVFGLSPENFGHYSPDVVICLAPPLDDILQNREKDGRRTRDEEPLAELGIHEKLNFRLLKLISERTGVPLIVDDRPNGTVPYFVRSLGDIIERVKPVKLYSVADANTEGSFHPETTPFLREKSFVDHFPIRLEEIADVVDRVRSSAGSWSQQTNRPVYLVNNLVGGAVFQYGMPHWLSQFGSEKKARAFTKRVKQSTYWKNYKLLGEKPFAIRSFLIKPCPEVHYNGNDYILQNPEQFRQGLYDMAIMDTARELMMGGKLNSFVYSIAETLVPQAGRIHYVSSPLSRIGDVVNLPGINVMVADTSKNHKSSSFASYDRELINVSTPHVRYTGLGLDSLEWGDISDEDDYHKQERLGRGGKPPSIEVNWGDKKPSFFPSGSNPWPSAEELGNLNVVYFDPYMRRDRTNVWWDGVPEIAYGATNVLCETNLGPVNLKDFLRISVARELGLNETRKGWEHDVEGTL